MLTCKEFDEFMLTHLKGGLPAWQKYMCWLHVKMCRECGDFVANHRRNFSKSLSTFEHPQTPVPGSVPKELVQATLVRQIIANARNVRLH
jgi:hypothetical protein